MDKRDQMSQVLPLPPEQLRFNVSNTRDTAEFLAVGRRCANDLMTGLESVGGSILNCKEVLDWGCGCGRTLRWLQGLSAETRLSGCDVDAAAVEWCRENLKRVGCEVTTPYPPLPYRDSTFDLVFGISVFTHLNQIFQQVWLNELNRVIIPKGYLLLSVMGTNIADTLPEDLRSEFYHNGFLFVHSPVWEGIHAEWYADAYQSERFVRDSFSRHFEVLSYTSAGMNGHQDLVVMRKPA
jgi:ubiquinone/menaquinone biosynthesis C-methylase UbiE